ncbi:MAG: peptide-methionine (S)-S-oxide reductase MsrA [Gammaproteobacteria bacterium]|nr:peptide-methionine (S)-S-oxide reductase MsrA [Gammaproteobacteria bacterium]
MAVGFTLLPGKSFSTAPQVKNGQTIKALDIKTNQAMMSSNTDSIVLGLGCFWGAEKRFEQMAGVIDVVSGYADGRGLEPAYQEIIKRKHRFNPNNYAEVIHVTFDRDSVSLETLLKRFFEMHDPTLVNRQGNDVGTQYRSTILFNSEQQQSISQIVKQRFQLLLNDAGYGEIATIIKPLDAFHPAEEYHQDYIAKNPNGYCPDHSTGVTFSNSENNKGAVTKLDNTALLQGKKIVIIDSEFCPYCDKFKQDVANDYKGSIPMVFREASQLHELKITSPTWATPTILFMNNGVEQFGIQGYVNATDFYKALGYFKLGESEAFNVAFAKGTDARFCKQYELFKNTGDGVFVDKLSGEPLFDTRYRFNSGTGWLSFTQAVEDSVIYKKDYSYGMQRVEVRAKTSDIHLGHVFNDGPNGKPRYCINATVLDFVPRSES